MSTFALREARLAGGLATLFCVGMSGQVTAQSTTSVPDFSSNQVGWVAVGDLMPVAGKPSPVRQDPAHRYVPNNVGGQPTYRMGDLSNPNLKPWVKGRMKKDNDEVLAGKIGYTARLAARRPAFRAINYPVRGLLHQTPKQVVMILGDAQVRRILNVPHSRTRSRRGMAICRIITNAGRRYHVACDNYRGEFPYTTKLHGQLLENGRGEEALEATITVEDLDAFNEPFGGGRYRRVLKMTGVFARNSTCSTTSPSQQA